MNYIVYFLNTYNKRDTVEFKYGGNRYSIVKIVPARYDKYPNILYSSVIYNFEILKNFILLYNTTKYSEHPLCVENYHHAGYKYEKLSFFILPDMLGLYPRTTLCLYKKQWDISCTPTNNVLGY